MADPDPVPLGPDDDRRDLRDLERLFEAEYARSVRLAVLLVGDGRIAEELAQDAFVRIAPKLDRIDNPAAYLRTIVVNLCRDHGRRVATERRQPPPKLEVAPEPPLPADTSEIWRAIQALPDPRREVLVLRYWADLPTAEIARLLQIPHPTVRTRIRRGLASLKEVLSDER
ncbi:MAG: RNA polymerase sigma factor [Aquihabitans sp.]